MPGEKYPVLIMETGVNPVTAGGSRAGWVSGDPSGLAASGAVSGGVVFDLGPEWAQYPYVAVNLHQPSGGTPSTSFNVQPSGSDTPAYNGARRLGYPAAVTGSNSYVAMNGAGSQNMFLRPMGRYVACIVTNGDATNAFNAGSKITLTAYPN